MMVCRVCGENVTIEGGRVIRDDLGLLLFIAKDSRFHEVVTKEKKVEKSVAPEPVEESESPASARYKRLLAKQELRKKREEENVQTDEAGSGTGDQHSGE
jgi:hypothetical protein